MARANSKENVMRLREWTQNPYVVHALIGLIFIALGVLFVSLGLTPAHDAIGGYGRSHFFYDNLARGIIPFWSPYSQTGMPFYPSFQNLGLWEPSNYLFVLLQKISGWSTLTTYVLHYLFYYCLFIMGAYNLFRNVTNKNGVSCLFAMVLLLASFPVIMRQIGALAPFYLLPMATFLFFKFFDEDYMGRKGFYLFCAVSLCAISCLNYIPSYTIFYVVTFLPLAFVFKTARVQDLWRFVSSVNGRLWIGASFMTAALIVVPVIALFVDIRFHGELFPLSRLWIGSKFHLIKLFASEMTDSLFSQTTNIPVSVTIANIIGLLLEPNLYLPGIELHPSEILLYIGLLPLCCAFLFMMKAGKVRNPKAEVLLMTAFISMLIMSNFKGEIIAPLGIFQRWLVAIVPSLDKIEVFELFGTPFLFCLTAVAAVGFSWAVESRFKPLWACAMAIWCAKYLVAMPLIMYLARRFYLSEPYATIRVLLFGCFPIGILGYLIIARGSFIRRLQVASVALLFVDLAFFNLVHLSKIEDDNDGWGIKSHYREDLMREGVFPPRREDTFVNYREPYLPSTMYNSSGFELLSATKVAWPALFNAFFGGANVVDSDYSMKSYYDYLTHIELISQLTASGVTSPILNFYPTRHVVPVANVREAVAAMSRFDAGSLAQNIFVEQEPQKPSLASVNQDFSGISNPQNYLTITDEDVLNVLRFSSTKFPSYPGFKCRVEYFDPNRLAVTAEIPKDGHFFFGDGFSKHWKALIDGQPAKIEKTNVNFKSVFVRQGRRRIEFIYNPVGIRWAMYVSFVAYVMAGLLALFYICRYGSAKRAA